MMWKPSMTNSNLVLALAGVLVALGALVIYARAASRVELKPGDIAPAFSLAGSDGRTHALADSKGKAVVLAWFPKAFTTGCTKECRSLRESGDEIRRFEATYYAISVDRPETNRRFAESLAVDYPILSDPEKTIAQAYGVLNPLRLASRWMFYIDAGGKIAYVDKTIHTATAAKDIAARLEHLRVPRR
jgi:peroxiredoxin Q/BCP